MTDDARRYAPAVARNREPIWRVVRDHLPASGMVLEVASGTGEHIVDFAGRAAVGHHRDAPGRLTFQPSDPDPTARASIACWVTERGLSNLALPLDLDAASPDWPLDRADMVMCINMIHIAPWSATVGLITGAARILPAGGTLFLYGPFRRAGVPTAVSNDAFDADLRARNPSWGLRDLETVHGLASHHGFGEPLVVEMPANNVSVVFTRML
jgi:hypothetical protein